MQVINTGSVRIDLVGGTIDLEPINFILKDTVTINMATNLKAKVLIDDNPNKIKKNQIFIFSKDYNNEFGIQIEDLKKFSASLIVEKFPTLNFVLLILKEFDIQKELYIELESGSPAGAGLGGSSAMGVTLYSALAKYFDKNPSKIEIIKIVKNIESVILNKGVTGYQDYYPALFGGILALSPTYNSIKVTQLFSQSFIEYLEKRARLVFSGISRNSGINNWEVYKSFFDKNEETIFGLSKIASISNQTLDYLNQNKFDLVISCIIEEGMVRKNLFKNIEPIEIQEFASSLNSKSPSNFYIKMCGAGGGGCFLLLSKEEIDPKIDTLIDQELNKFKMQKLNFQIEPPIE